MLLRSERDIFFRALEMRKFAKMEIQTEKVAKTTIVFFRWHVNSTFMERIKFTPSAS